ncbi:MAG: hypothetical protein MRY57_01095 [Candidatus Pacebacteria bacterium]|nr:hypothetical protein [Candidatus Paceibacterota bacterium]
MKNNGAKTALMFLGIIALVLIGRMFWNEHELLVKQEDSQVANSACAVDERYC